MKVAMMVLADTETHEALGRVVNAMVAVLEFKEAGDEVQLIFDGGGTRWPPVLSQPDHSGHKLYARVEGTVRGACSYCADAFETTEALRDLGVTLLDEYKRHPSVRSLMAEGYQVLTY
jgi:hypothetical protein